MHSWHYYYSTLTCITLFTLLPQHITPRTHAYTTWNAIIHHTSTRIQHAQVVSCNTSKAFRRNKRSSCLVHFSLFDLYAYLEPKALSGWLQQSLCSSSLLYLGRNNCWKIMTPTINKKEREHRKKIARQANKKHVVQCGGKRTRVAWGYFLPGWAVSKRKYTYLL